MQMNELVKPPAISRSKDFFSIFEILQKIMLMRFSETPDLNLDPLMRSHYHLAAS